MRYPPDQRQKTRERILSAAADLLRGRGIAATGVDQIMAAAGLTAGGFYSHFRSKDALVADAIDAAAEKVRLRWYARQGLGRASDRHVLEPRAPRRSGGGLHLAEPGR
jgi:AcrR family transcriptional regulator